MLLQPTPPGKKRKAGKKRNDKIEKDDQSESDATSVTPSQPDGYASSRYSDNTQQEEKQSNLDACDPRHESLRVHYTPEEVERIATDIYNECAADVLLSLFSWWIRASPENFEIAKRHIRELGLDQGYNIHRIQNAQLRKLLEDVQSVRPQEPVQSMDKVVGAESPTPIALSGTPRSLRSVLSTMGKPRLAILPPSLRAERDRVIQEAARSASMTSVSSPTRDYPPNSKFYPS